MYKKMMLKIIIISEIWSCGICAAMVCGIAIPKVIMQGEWLAALVGIAIVLAIVIVMQILVCVMCKLAERE